MYRLKTIILLIICVLFAHQTEHAFGLGGMLKKKLPFGNNRSSSKDFSSHQRDIVQQLAGALKSVNKAIVILAEVYGLKELARSKYIQARELDPNDQGAMESTMGATAEALETIQKTQQAGQTYDKKARRKARKARTHLTNGAISGYGVTKNIRSAVKGIQKEIRNVGGGGFKPDLRSGNMGGLNKINELKKKFGTLIWLGKNYPKFIQKVVTTSKIINQNLKKAGIDSRGRKNQRLDKEMQNLEF